MRPAAALRIVIPCEALMLRAIDIAIHGQGPEVSCPFVEAGRPSCLRGLSPSFISASLSECRSELPLGGRTQRGQVLPAALPMLLSPGRLHTSAVLGWGANSSISSM